MYFSVIDCILRGNLMNKVANYMNNFWKNINACQI